MKYLKRSRNLKTKQIMRTSRNFSKIGVTNDFLHQEPEYNNVILPKAFIHQCAKF